MIIYADVPADVFNVVFHGKFSEATSQQLTALMRAFNDCTVIKTRDGKPTGDLISRSALRDKVFYHDYTPIVVDDAVNDVATEILRLINDAPTVEVRDGYDEGYVMGLEDGAKRAQLGEVDFKDNILEAYRLITDQEFEHTNSFWITTPKGKKILFKKAETEEADK